MHPGIMTSDRWVNVARVAAPVARAVLVALIVLTTSIVRADDFAKGLAAHEAEDYETAFAIWKPLADAGHAEAQFRIGQLYEFGPQRGGDLETAIHYYRMAADAGQPDASENLGLRYLYGIGGMVKNEAKALPLLKRAANKKKGTSLFALGFYYSPLGREHDLRGHFDYETSIFYLEQAAKLGLPKAQGYFGNLLIKFREKAHDTFVGMMWIRTASITGGADEKKLFDAINSAVEEDLSRPKYLIWREKIEFMARTCIKSDYQNCG